MAPGWRCVAHAQLRAEAATTLDLFLIALVIAIEPLPLTSYLVVLGSRGGPAKGLGFVVGWLATLILVVVLTLTLTGGKPVQPGSVPSTAALVVTMLLGAGLLGLAVWQRSRRGRPKAPASWMKAVDRMSFGGAMILGFLVQPWPLVAAGAATVLQADLSQVSSVVALIGFCVIASLTYLLGQGYVWLAPAAAHVRLANLNRWITTHTDQIIIVASTAIGLWLIVRSIAQLAS